MTSLYLWKLLCLHLMAIDLNVHFARWISLINSWQITHKLASVCEIEIWQFPIKSYTTIISFKNNFWSSSRWHSWNHIERWIHYALLRNIPGINGMLSPRISVKFLIIDNLEQFGLFNALVCEPFRREPLLNLLLLKSNSRGSGSLCYGRFRKTTYRLSRIHIFCRLCQCFRKVAQLGDT